MRLLAEHRPDDAVLSEEGPTRSRQGRPALGQPGLDRRPARRHPGVLRAAARRLGRPRRPVGGRRASSPAPSRSRRWGRPSTPASRRWCRRAPPSRPRIAVSRSRPPAFVNALAEELDAELVPMGSAGVKVISVARDVTDAYVHAGGQYEWDSAAPVAVARAAGLFTSRVDGTPLRYNQEDVYLPGPHRLPPRARRADRRVRQAARHRLTRRSAARGAQQLQVQVQGLLRRVRTQLVGQLGPVGLEDAQRAADLAERRRAPASAPGAPPRTVRSRAKAADCARSSASRERRGLERRDRPPR